MKKSIVFIFVFNVFISCCNYSGFQNCNTIVKVDSYSIGYPNITFMVEQTEKMVRENHNKTILDMIKLKRINKRLKELKKLKSTPFRGNNVIGVSDVYCISKDITTIIYYRGYLEINGDYFFIDSNLIHDLYKNNSLLELSSLKK